MWKERVNLFIYLFIFPRFHTKPNSQFLVFLSNKFIVHFFLFRCRSRWLHLRGRRSVSAITVCCSVRSPPFSIVVSPLPMSILTRRETLSLSLPHVFRTPLSRSGHRRCQFRPSRHRRCPYVVQIWSTVNTPTPLSSSRRHPRCKVSNLLSHHL